VRSFLAEETLPARLISWVSQARERRRKDPSGVIGFLNLFHLRFSPQVLVLSLKSFTLEECGEGGERKSLGIRVDEIEKLEKRDGGELGRETCVTS